MNQRIRSFTTLTAAVALSALPVLAPPSHAAESRVPITDPQLLERMGFAPDATNVYATPQALQQLLMGPDAGNTIREETEEAPAESVFGDDDAGESAASGSAFEPMAGDTGYETFSGGTRYCTIGSPFFEADLHGLPHGARLVRVRSWFLDESAEDMELFLFRTCTLESDPTPSVTNLGSSSSAGSGGWDTSVFSVGEDIDLEHCTYAVRARLDDANVGSCSEGSDLGILKARAQWRRQVSPAPDTATFDDVPTNHLFFQHIEALADSGITAGCGNDNFCPNEPLTRGQMADFLSTALGLHWDFPHELP